MDSPPLSSLVLNDKGFWKEPTPRSVGPIVGLEVFTSGVIKLKHWQLYESQNLGTEDTK